MKICPHCGGSVPAPDTLCPQCHANVAAEQGPPPAASGRETRLQRVVVTDVEMPMGSMIVFMIKWAVASIPALVIVAGVTVCAAGLLSAVIGWGAPGSARAIASDEHPTADFRVRSAGPGLQIETLASRGTLRCVAALGRYVSEEPFDAAPGSRQELAFYRFVHQGDRLVSSDVEPLLAGGLLLACSDASGQRLTTTVPVSP